MNNEDYDPEDRIGPYNGHTPWEPGGGCLFIIILFFLGLALLASAGHSHARDLGQWENSDPSVREWYQALKQPDHPESSCCGEADAYWCDDLRVNNGKKVCTITDDRPDEPLHRPHVEIGTIIEIPDHKLKWDRGNPTGHGVVFLSYMNFVFCYVQGGGV